MNLAQVYRGALTKRIAAIEAGLDALASNPEEAAESLRRLAHSLRGSGATYGFPEVTEAAAAVEDAPADQLALRGQELLAVVRTVAALTAPPAACILVIDDDPEISMLLEHILQAPDRTIVVAGTWAEAQEVLKKRNVALIVLDLMLPDADGRTALVRLREAAATSEIPIIVLSGKAGPLPRAESLALGADAYVEKPFDFEAFARDVEARLRVERRPSGPVRIDAATGLFNRAGLRDAFRRATSAGTPTALSSMCLSTVEGSARPVTAAMVRAAAAVISETVQPETLLAHWGDGELVLLHEGLGEAEARAELVEALAAFSRAAGDPESDRLTGVFAMAGVTGVDPDTDFAEAIDQAEEQRTRAARRGRFMVVGASDPETREGLRILIADDDPLIASLLEHRLARAGVEVETTDSGAEALRRVRAAHFDCLVLDVRLPELDGFAVLEAIRGDPVLSDTRVIMLTAMGHERDVVRGLSLGADDYVVKPFSPVEFTARLWRVLGR